MTGDGIPLSYWMVNITLNSRGRREAAMYSKRWAAPNYESSVKDYLVKTLIIKDDWIYLPLGFNYLWCSFSLSLRVCLLSLILQAGICFARKIRSAFIWKGNGEGFA